MQLCGVTLRYSRDAVLLWRAESLPAVCYRSLLDADGTSILPAQMGLCFSLFPLSSPCQPEQCLIVITASTVSHFPTREHLPIASWWRKPVWQWMVCRTSGSSVSTRAFCKHPRAVTVWAGQVTSWDHATQAAASKLPRDVTPAASVCLPSRVTHHGMWLANHRVRAGMCAPERARSTVCCSGADKGDQSGQ